MNLLVPLLTILSLSGLFTFTITMINYTKETRINREQEKIRSMSLAELVKNHINKAPENTWWEITTIDDSIQVKLLNIYGLLISDVVKIYENGKRRSNWRLKNDLHSVSQSLIEKYEFKTLNQDLEFFGV